MAKQLVLERMLYLQKQRKNLLKDEAQVDLYGALGAHLKMEQ